MNDQKNINISYFIESGAIRIYALKLPISRQKSIHKLITNKKYIDITNERNL